MLTIDTAVHLLCSILLDLPLILPHNLLTSYQPARTHLPGQYVDLYLPNIEAVGGFTITSPPSTTRLSTSPYIELAIQKSPNNPPAAHLWQPAQDILNTPASFRIGGSFIYPPPTFSRDECGKIDRAVFVAGGVGINPIMSMLSAMNSAGPRRIGGLPAQTRVLYTSRRSRDDNNKPEAVLFEDRLQQLAHSWANSKDVDYQYTFFETSKGGQTGEDKNIRYQDRRIQHADLLEALGPEDQRSNTVIYVCGLPAMTDEFVEILRKAKGMDQRRVLVEKWW